MSAPRTALTARPPRPGHRHRRRLAAAVAVAAVALTPVVATTVPAAAAETRVDVDVTDFGADPTGRADSAAAVRDALRHAAELDSPTRIVFPTGTYQLYPDQAEVRELYVSNTVGADQRYKDKRIAILVEDMDDVVVDGEGSRFVMHGEQTIFAAIRSTDVVFEDFSTTWLAPRALDLTVVASGTANGQTYRDVRVPDGYGYTVSGTTVRWSGETSPYTGQPYWTDQNAFSYTQGVDLATGKSLRGSVDGISTNPFQGVTAITDLGDRRLRFVYGSGTAPGPVGRVFQMRRDHRDTPGGFIWEGARTTVRDAELGHLHGFGIVAQLTRDVTIDGVDFRQERESWATTAAFADILQVSGAAGTVTVTDNQFGFAHDDPINIHGTYVELVSVDGPRTATFAYKHHQTAGFPQFYPGDDLALVAKATMTDVAGGAARVVSVDGPTGTDSSKNLTRMTVTVDRDLPAGLVPGQVVAENTTYNPEVVIRGNHFESLPTRGILVTTREPVLIEDNDFDQMGMASIYVSADAAAWYESSAVTDLTVRGNRFTRAASPVIWFDPTSAGNDPARTTHTGVVIEDNEFVVGSDVTLVQGKSVGGLEFRDNTVVRDDASRTLTAAVDRTTLGVGDTAVVTATGAGASAGNTLFRFQGSRDVVLEGNAYDAGFNRRVDVSSMPAGNVTVRDAGFRVGADARTDGLGTVSYASSDPGVVSVDAAGVLTARAAGTATVRAVATSETGATESAPVTVTVTGDGGSASSISVDPPQAALALPDAQVQLTATTDAAAVAWSVRDVTTGAPATGATVDAAGLFRATARGAYEVTARAGAASASALVSVDQARVPGPHGMTVVRPDASRVSTVGEDTLRLTSAEGFLWATMGTARNVHLAPQTLDVGEAAVVRISGRTGGTWEEAGLILYRDDDNYVALQRKQSAGQPALRVVTEENGSPEESRSIADPTATALWLRLTRTAQGLQGAWSTDGTAWTNLGSPVVNTSALSGKVGVLAVGGASSTRYDFSGLTVGADQVPLVRAATPPTATDVVATAGPGTLEAAWSYADPDGDAQSGSVVRWYAQEDGAWRPFATGTSVGTPADVAGLPVRAVVVPADATGSLGAPSAASAPVTAAVADVADDDASLRSVTVGNAAAGSPAGATEGTWLVGPSTDVVTVDARATHPEAEVAVLVDGDVVDGSGPAGVVVPLGDAAATDVQVRVTAPSGDVATWTQHVVRRGGRDAGLAEATLSAGLPGVPPQHHVTALPADVASYTARFRAADPAATVTARLDGQDLAPAADGTFTVPVHRGVTVLEVWVTAGDGVTARPYRWVTLSERAATPGPAPAARVDVEAQVRCVAGRAYVAVRAVNEGVAPVGLELATSAGTRSFADVAPGKQAYQQFATRATSAAAGTARVTVTSGATTQVVEEPYDGASC